ncbi:ATP-binding protein [Runella sp.]|uniref:ATP-binding protein n=1 Tax=Runella sp. TaxID=1960881 RepID=UPI003D1035A8
MKKKLLIYCFIFACYPEALFAQIILSDSAAIYPITALTTVFEDKTGKMSFEEVQKQSFTNRSNPDRLKGQSHSVFWIKLTVRNQRPDSLKRWLLAIEKNYYLSDLDLYFPTREGGFSITKIGNAAAFSKREIKSKDYAVPLALVPQKTQVCYLRLKSLLYINHDLVIYDELTFYKSFQKEDNAFFLVSGLLLMRLFFCIALLFFINDTKFRAYCFYGITASSTMYLGTGGSGFTFPQFPAIANHLWIILSNIHLVALAYFVYQVCQVKTKMPALTPVFWVLGSIGVVHGIATLVYRPSVYFMHFYTLNNFIILCILFYSLLRKYYASIWYIIPVMVFAVYHILSQLNNLDIIYLPNIIKYAKNLALSLELLGVAPVTGYLLRSLYEEKLATAKDLILKNQESQKFRELDRLKTRFFNNISHEFRTPLTLILGPLDELQKRLPNESILPIMQRNAKRLLALINQLLDLGKLEAREMQVDLQKGDVAAFLQQLLASFESLAQSKNIIFQHEQSHSHKIVYFDVDKLEKIVTNLLSNAFKFTPEQGRINVRVSYEEHQVMIRVEDFGIGIDAERLSRIFDRFYQVDTGNRRDYEGTGIGLTLVKELVEVLQGSIDVKSQPGKGSVFTVTLPCTTQPPQLAANEEPIVIKPTEPVLSTITMPDPNEVRAEHLQNELPMLLVVEDNPDLRTYVRGIFAESYQIIEAIDGQNGLEKAIEFVPDVVICDLMMPRLDGFGFCKALKTDTRTNHIPVVMLTAKATLEDRLEGFELGADDYLSKPFNTEELQTRVRNLVVQRQSLRQKYSQPFAISVNGSEAIETKKILSMDEKFLQKANGVLHRNLADSGFDVEKFASEMGVTALQLRRKLKALTGQTVIEYIRSCRLEKAAELLRNKAGTVSDIGYQVGFESLSYFSKVFTEKFGKAPSEWN